MVDVIWKGKGPAQRIQDRLKQGSDNYPLRPSVQTVTQQQTITKIYFGASQSDSDRGHGGPDEVSAFVASKGGIR